jgi:hypothetical protein
MTTSSHPTAQTSPLGRYLGVGVAASVVHMLLMIPGYSDTGDLQVGAYTVVFVISVAVAVVLFALVVPRGGAVTAVVLGVVAVVTVLVFWLGVTLPIAAAAVLLGIRERAAGRRVTLATVGAGLGVVGALLTVAIIIGDATS